MKNLFAIITFASLTICFSILWLAVLMQLENSDKAFTQWFAIAFVTASLSFLGYLKLENRKTK
jgi:predicted permease